VLIANKGPNYNGWFNIWCTTKVWIQC
jgi:hypothetical protein